MQCMEYETTRCPMKRAASDQYEEDDARTVLQRYLEEWEVEGRRVSFGDFALVGGNVDLLMSAFVPPLLEVEPEHLRLVEGVVYIKVRTVISILMSDYLTPVLCRMNNHRCPCPSSSASTSRCPRSLSIPSNQSSPPRSRTPIAATAANSPTDTAPCNTTTRGNPSSGFRQSDWSWSYRSVRSS